MRAKIAARVGEGELVEVLERRVGQGTTFLRLRQPQGWVFDMQPCERQKRQRMVQVEIYFGAWIYRVFSPKGISLRARCSFTEDAKIKTCLSCGALLEVAMQVRVGETTFLKLEDGRGWAFDQKDGEIMVEGPIDLRVLHNVTANVRSGEPCGIYLMREPTRQKWSQTNRFLLDGAHVQVRQLGEVEDQQWAQVSQAGGGMDGWCLAGALDFDANKAFWTAAARGGRLAEGYAALSAGMAGPEDAHAMLSSGL